MLRRVQAHLLANLGGILGGVEDPAELAGGQGIDRVLPRPSVTPLGLRPHAVTSLATSSHPDCRKALILIVVRYIGLLLS